MKRLLIPLMLCQIAAYAVAQASSSSVTSSTSSGSSVSTSVSTSTGGGGANAQAVSFSCGGVGDADQRRMKADAARHDLLVTFAGAHGAYVADVDVEILRAGNVVAQGRCSGPLMLVDLSPKGRYELRARFNGQVQTKAITLSGKPASLTFSFAAS